MHMAQGLVLSISIHQTWRKLSMSSLVRLEPGADTTMSRGRSVHFGWGMAITAASNTYKTIPIIQ